ncbi:DUF4242 domain-containing protein [Alicyclobacillus macrosporangiidus]|uniref:DUF4242 domain-containing protein n=1 Tax=Alicyclobacillus macrosporangiidus TaxID=392015 RepID=UPI000497EF56|nr:DUF4242 domain-containing protein [Alicyclobacillus macrosporangiidus]
MGLYLVESVLPRRLRDQAALEDAANTVAGLAAQRASELIEVQVASDFTRAFFVVESENQGTVRQLFTDQAIPVTLVKPVRLVGADLDQVKANAAKVRFVVEWNLPEGLTMDAYLQRKKQNSVHYAEVPEVTFQRTYVCEDMTKCLCFYDSPDEETVYAARRAVSAPVDAITETVQISPRK